VQLFTAEAKPFVNKSALPFPAVSVDMIAGGTSVDLAHYFSNKVTLVTVSFQAHGKMQSDMWHAPFLQAFSDDTGNLVKGVQVRRAPLAVPALFPTPRHRVVTEARWVCVRRRCWTSCTSRAGSSAPFATCC
jgi:hypothetical protein